MAIILPQQRIAYFPAPKSACTSIKTLFFEIENGRPFPPLTRHGRLFHIHDFYGTIPFARHDPAQLHDHWRFAVFRDPIARFLSCYSNRVVHFRELSASMLSDKAQAAGALPDPDLDTFVRRLEIYREHSPSIQHHTAPQVVFLGRDPEYFQRIYPMSALPDLVADLSQRIGRTLNLPHEQRGGPKLRREDLSPEAQAILETFYRADLRWGEKAGLGGSA